MLHSQAWVGQSESATDWLHHMPDMNILGRVVQKVDNVSNVLRGLFC